MVGIDHGPVKQSHRAQVPPFAVMDLIAAANARRAAGQDVINLAAGEPAGGAARVVREAAARAITEHDLGYTEAVGMPELRSAIADHAGVDAARVAVTTGSSGGFLLAFLACFDVGDRVALARPGYPAYRNILRSLGCEVVDLPCGPATRYQPTVAMLERVDPPLAGLVLASPANPTGTLVPDLADIARWCAERGARLVSDEIYHGITYAGPTRSAAEFPDAVVVNSFSKYWGLTGWRVGWLVLPEVLVPTVDALAGNLALCPPAVSQRAALAALSPAGMADAAARVERYRAARDLLLQRLPELGWGGVVPPDGAFYLYADISGSGLDSRAWCARLLEEAGVALTPGTDFDPVEGHRTVRLSFAGGPDVVAAAVDRILAWQGR